MRMFWLALGLLVSPSVRRRWRTVRGRTRVVPRLRWRRLTDDELRAQIAAGERNPDWMMRRTLERLYSPRECPCSQCVAVREGRAVHPLQLI